MNLHHATALLLLACIELVAAGGQGNQQEGSFGINGLSLPKKKDSKGGDSKGESSSEDGRSGSRDSGDSDDSDDSDDGSGSRTGGGSIPLTLTNIRSFDGSEDPRSAPDAELLRLSGPNTYPDGIGAEGAESQLFFPNARMISNTVADPNTLPLDLDHDIGLTEGVAEEFTITSPDCSTDTICTIPMRRAVFHWNDATPQTREQLNEINGFLDASSV
eukprot:CAMPEP_0117028848 /NCGR_PEP_ID=MMETSP0472-20121206/20943_1 /TAXON_ID=693140 ORGANISM="Tiarina fusus, Strain LIS" /NCGR_SAMPLE_ID=MMETSP0472 /ASSEMBLY_ACC=CAM_ASM_000603 /LENGTH=216 /DNA_ID=CAMNT_0004736457 /DNA_START=85 /DNA_END=733 /DNA_ORIENTATION=+